MKNIQVISWTRTPDTEMNMVDYRKKLANDIEVSVNFDDFDNSYEVRTVDTGTYENDIRTKYKGVFENTKENITGILTKAETVNHYSKSSKNLFF